MTNENSAYINFFTVNFSGSQGEIRRPSVEKYKFSSDIIGAKSKDVVNPNFQKPVEIQPLIIGTLGFSKALITLKL
jgi:hypothetical protein